MNEKLGVLIKNKVIIFIAAFIAIGLLFVAADGSRSDTQKQESLTEEEREEERIKNLVESLEGVANVKVLITFEEENKTISAGTFYSSENENKKNIGIKGIAVSADGGDDPLIREKIKSLLCAAYDISDTKIFVCGK